MTYNQCKLILKFQTFLEILAFKKAMQISINIIKLRADENHVKTNKVNKTK